MNDQPIPAAEDCYGFLVVQVTTARGAIPLEHAQVDISTYDPVDPPPETKGTLIATLMTDSDGNTPTIRLPSPPCSNADSPDSGRPYALYQAEVRHDGYYDQIHVGIPVYEGITVIQPVVLIPLPEDGTQLPPPETRYFDNETNEITEGGY